MKVSDFLMIIDLIRDVVLALHTADDEEIDLEKIEALRVDPDHWEKLLSDTGDD